MAVTRIHHCLHDFARYGVGKTDLRMCIHCGAMTERGEGAVRYEDGTVEIFDRDQVVAVQPSVTRQQFEDMTGYGPKTHAAGEG